jgi:hypothetical protein
MLKFISSLFSSEERRADGLDKSIIDEAIERAVEGTDRRLRGFGDYRKRLRASVEAAANYVVDFVDTLPEPVEISPGAYNSDARLRAFFASADRMREVFGGFTAVDDYLKNKQGLKPGRLYGLLMMKWQEKQVLGMELQNEIVKRDVLQVTYNFFNHIFIGPTDDEDQTRWELKTRAFDFMVEQALERIVQAQGKRGQLKEQKRLLEQKLEKMNAGNWGFSAMQPGNDNPSPDLVSLEEEIESIERGLQALSADRSNIEGNFDHINQTLGNPAACLSKRNIDITLDEMLIKRDSNAGGRVNRLDLLEFYAANGERRIALNGWISTSDLPRKKDFLDEASRYLG